MLAKTSFTNGETVLYEYQNKMCAYNKYLIGLTYALELNTCITITSYLGQFAGNDLKIPVSVEYAYPNCVIEKQNRQYDFTKYSDVVFAMFDTDSTYTSALAELVLRYEKRKSTPQQQSPPQPKQQPQKPISIINSKLEDTEKIMEKIITAINSQMEPSQNNNDKSKYFDEPEQEQPKQPEQKQPKQPEQNKKAILSKISELEQNKELVSEFLELEKEKLKEEEKEFDNLMTEYSKIHRKVDLEQRKEQSKRNQFECEKQTYRMFLKRFLTNNSSYEIIPPLFKSKFPVYMFMDGRDNKGNKISESILNEENAFDIFAVLHMVFEDDEEQTDGYNLEDFEGILEEFIKFLPDNYNVETPEQIMKRMNDEDTEIIPKIEAQ